MLQDSLAILMFHFDGVAIILTDYRFGRNDQHKRTFQET